ncbi:hypothetical protein IFR05_006097 [Cadophora sp. M221]|nr:hypothetical protein IFR05_006097 [Cadophora sp. M221]
MSILPGYEYTYTPLTSPNEFRLILLNQGKANSPAEDILSIEFLPARFGQSCTYTALSYAWGTDSDAEVIQVKGARTRMLKITKSLACALRSLRSSHYQIFWIDALCIDQNNVEEKNYQVSRMAEIYRRANEVVIWLGEAANDSKLAMDFMANISVKNIDELAANPEYTKSWSAIADLMRRSWFKRRWVVQEVAFARQPVLRSALVAPDIVLPHLPHALLALLRSSIGELRGVGVHSLIAVYDRALPHGRDGEEPHGLCTMEALLSYLPEFEATDGRDVVFALASLAKDYTDFIPDYSQSVIRVYKNAIEQAVATSHSLNIVCRPWAQPLPNLPSWILPHLALPFRRNYEDIYVRQRADTLVCLAHQSVYHASGSVPASANFNDDEFFFILTCKGFHLPTVSWIGERAEEGIIPNSWHHSLRGTNIEQRDLKEMYWRTLVVDRDSKGNSPPRWYSMACADAHELCSNGSLDTKKLLNGEGEEISSMLKEFLRRVQAATWNRRLVRLADDSLGLAPERTMQEDRICILFGCDVPVVLRRLDGGTWAIMGEAFVYGAMDGEALDRSYEDVTFNLV